MYKQHKQLKQASAQLISNAPKKYLIIHLLDNLRLHHTRLLSMVMLFYRNTQTSTNPIIELIELEQKKSELLLQTQELEYNNQELQEQVEYQAGVAEDALKQVDEYEDEILLLRRKNGNRSKQS
jgi:hypothetical protein